jgi:hypothetical protein
MAEATKRLSQPSHHGSFHDKIISFKDNPGHRISFK